MKIYITTEKNERGAVRATLEIDDGPAFSNMTRTYKFPGRWHDFSSDPEWKREVKALAEWIGAMSEAMQDAQNKAARIEVNANPEYLPKHLMVQDDPH